MSKNAKLPTRATKESIGLDIYSAEDNHVLPIEHKTINTDISILLPTNCYGRLASKSGLASHHGIHIGAGVIDRDYQGVIKVVMFNHGTKIFSITKHQKIAQLICEKAEMPRVELWQGASVSTERGEGSFGSSGL